MDISLVVRDVDSVAVQKGILCVRQRRFVTITDRDMRLLEVRSERVLVVRRLRIEDNRRDMWPVASQRRKGGGFVFGELLHEAVTGCLAVVRV